MKRIFKNSQTQGTVLAATLILLVMGSGVFLLQAFRQVA